MRTPIMYISSLQLFSMMMLFEFGSATVIGLGTEARQSSWVVVLLGMLLYLPVFYVICSLYKKETTSFPQLLSSVLGKHLGLVITFLYGLYFFYIGARVLRDFNELLLLTSLQGTPAFFVSLMMMSAVCYACILKIEVIARASSLLFFVFLIFLAVGFGLIFFSQILDPRHLLPLLEPNGINTIWHATFPTVVTFPFGEMIVLFCYAHYLKKPSRVKKTGIVALIVSAVILSSIEMINMSALGPYIARIASIPLLVTFQLVNIGDIIQRMDVIVIAILMIGGFVKITLFMYAAVLCFKEIYRVEEETKLIIPLGIATVALGHFMANTYIRHLQIGLEIIPMYVHIPAQIIIPLLLVIVYKSKQMLLRRKQLSL